MSTAVHVDPEVRHDAPPASTVRVVADGKFLRAGNDRFLVKGVTYGTFAPDAEAYQFPSLTRISCSDLQNQRVDPSCAEQIIRSK